MTLFEKLAKWLVFSVLPALLSVAFNYPRILTRSGDPTTVSLLGKGELLLIAAGISAAAVGNLMGSGKEWLVAKIFAGGGAVIVPGLASLYFADVAAGPTSQPLDPAVNTPGS